MSIISKEALLKVLTAYNPWWKTGSIHPRLTKTYKRNAFYDVMNRLGHIDLRRIIVLTGARRVGKTTIMYQTIESLLLQGVKPQRIVYISLDHPVLKLSSFQDVLDCYHENVYPDQNVYYFLDEIQYAVNWDKWLKTLYDLRPECNVIATGSASPALVKGNQESGAGRWSLIQVPTLSFYEYCKLTGVEHGVISTDFHFEDLLQMNQSERQEILLKLSGLQVHLNRYLLVGGFPELAIAENDTWAQQLMREDVVDKVLKRDLPALYNIRNVTELERIFIYLCNVSSEIVSIETLAKELQGVSRPTVENYIRYLESANLIYLSWPIEMNGKKILKARPKIYVADAAIRNAVLMDEMILANAVEMGRVVETAVYKHVVSSFHEKAFAVGYFRSNSKQKEIDIVIEQKLRKNILIEVKYRENAVLADDDAICELIEEADYGVVVTKNGNDFGVHHTKCGKNLIRIPAYAFMFLLGFMESNQA